MALVFDEPLKVRQAVTGLGTRVPNSLTCVKVCEPEPLTKLQSEQP